MQTRDAHIVYCENRMLLDKGPYTDWRAIQDVYADYKASLGPWPEEDIVAFLQGDWGPDESRWPFSRDSIANFFRSDERLLSERVEVPDASNCRTIAQKSNDEMPPEIAEAIRDEMSRNMPKHSVGRMRVCEASRRRYVVRVFLDMPDLKPSPYCIYAVELPSMRAKQLKGVEADPFYIPNYK